MAKSSPIPPKDKKALLLQRMFDRSKKFRSIFDKDWEKNIEFLLGNQQMPKDYDWQANTITNLAFSNLYSIIPWVGGRRPEIQLDPRNPVLSELAEELSMIQSRVLTDNEVESRSIELVFSMVAIGCGYWKQTWNKRLNGGLGGIEMATVPAIAMFLQPGKPHARKCDYIFEVRHYDKLAALRRFPDKASQINALFRKDNTEVKEMQLTKGYGDAGVGYHAWFDSDPSDPNTPEPDTTSEAYFYDVAGSMDSDKSSLPFIEAHFWDNSTFEMNLEAQKKREMDKSKIKDPKRKRVARYPNGHVVTFCGGYILEDRDEPFPGHPYVQAHNYYIEGYPYSYSDLSLIKTIQEQVNESKNRTFDAVAKSIGQTLLAGPQSELEDDQRENRPDETIHVTEISDVRELERVRVNQGMFAWSQIAAQDMEKVLGIEEALRGEAPGEVRSGFAIEQLQQASANHMKLKTLALEVAIKDTAKYHTHMIAENYRPGIEFDPNILGGLVQPTADGDDRPMEIGDIRPYLFEYTVRAGINLRGSRAQDIQFYQWMLGADVIDKEYFVRHADIPGKAALLKRMKPKWERDEQMMEAQLAQQQAAVEQQAAVAQQGGLP